jgi:taurine dioxygenase
MTGYIDTAAVYDAMPRTLLKAIEGRRAIHSLGPIQDALRSAARADDEMEGGEPPAFEQVVHPLVHEHPESGRKVLNVSPAFVQAIEGLPENESRALLDELIAFATQDRFVYLHRWDVGDLIIWDNSRTMHLATGHKRRHARRMHRTTLAPGRVPSELAA